MDKPQDGRSVVVAHVSYAFLVFTAAVHVFTAGGASLFIAQVTGIDEAYAFPPLYLALVALTAYLVLRNGRWAVDDDFIYKGWRLARFIAISEIEHAQIGIPDNWITALAQLPGAGHMGLAASMQSSALVLRLSGDRWLVWEFSGMVNRDQFVNAILKRSPRGHTDCPVMPVPIWLPLLRVGRIIHG
jgi:hypothetical protein